MKLSAYGMRIALPDGWEGRIYRRPEGDPTLHAGNFPLPVADGDFGSGAIGQMPRRGIFVVLTEYRADETGRPLFAERGLGLPVTESLLSPDTMQRTRPGLSGHQRFFTQGERPFCLYVVVGDTPSPASLLSAANRVLRTLSLSPHRQRYAYAQG